MKAPFYLFALFVIVALITGVILFSNGGERDVLTLTPSEKSKSVAPVVERAAGKSQVDPRRRFAARIDTQQPTGKPSPSSSKSDQNSSLVGRIQTAEGAPIEGASLWIGPARRSFTFGQSQASLDLEAHSDASGEFRIPRGKSFENVELSVVVYARGFLVARRIIQADTKVGDGRLDIIELERGVIIGGQVIDSEGVPWLGQL